MNKTDSNQLLTRQGKNWTVNAKPRKDQRHFKNHLSHPIWWSLGCSWAFLGACFFSAVSEVNLQCCGLVVPLLLWCVWGLCSCWAELSRGSRVSCTQTCLLGLFGKYLHYLFSKYHVPFICEHRVAFLLAGFMLPSFCCVSVQVFPLVTVNLSAFPSSTWRCHFLFDDRSSAAQHWNPPGCEQSCG